MFDMILENYSKAVESTLKLQQEMLRNWTMQWSPSGAAVFGLPMTGNIDLGKAAADAGSGMAGAVEHGSGEVGRGRHRHAEEAPGDARRAVPSGDPLSMMRFRVGEARDPKQFRRLSEELWRRNCEVLKTAVTSQMHDVQSVMQKWYEAASGARRVRKSDRSIDQNVRWVLRADQSSVSAVRRVPRLGCSTPQSSGRTPPTWVPICRASRSTHPNRGDRRGYPCIREASEVLR